MSICELVKVSRLGVIAVVVGATIACGEPGDCLRYSDCAAGLTCADGKCVPPPSVPAAGAAGAMSDGGQADAASSSGVDGGPSVDDDGANVAAGDETSAE